MKTSSYVKVALLILLVIAAGLAWYVFGSSPKIKNVILISVDTCRADHLSCYGFGRKTTPNIDALAEEGVLFTNAISPIPLTLPAHSSMLTGTYPPYHKVHDNLNYKLDESNVSLAEILREQGYVTGGIISAFVLYTRFGIGQGFDYYNQEFVKPLGSHKDTERRGDEASRFANSFLKEHRGEKFFLFLHYYDPHTEYNPPEPYATNFADDLYAGEIAYTDYCIGQVIAQLKALDLYDSTLIVLVGDHGEGLGEHGETEHGYFVYQTSLKVPFIVRDPGSAKARCINDTVSLVDVPPTVLGFLDLAVPSDMQGKDLSPYARTKPPSNAKRNVYSESLTPTKYECNPLLALVGADWKYIETTKPELYDLVKDPGENNNLNDTETKRARLMRNQLRDLAANLVGSELVGSRKELSDEERKRLESLGYIGTGAMDDSFQFDQSKADPKEYIAYFEYVQEVTQLIYAEKYSEARVICAKMLQEFPEMPNTHFLLTRIASAEDNYVETIEQGLKYLELSGTDSEPDAASAGINPTKPQAKTHDLIANAAFKLEKFDLAIEHWSKAFKLKSDWPEVLNLLAAAYFEVGRLEEAITHWDKAIQMKPDWPAVHNNLASAYYKHGDLDLAIEHWSKAVEFRPDWPEVKKNLNVALALQKQDKQIEQLAEMLKNNPNDGDTHNNLATLYYRQQKIDLAIIHWTRAINTRPDWPEPHNNLAWVLAMADDVKLRNPSEAVRLAQRACELTDNNRPDMLDTLSVAYAADGDFASAVASAEKAKSLAEDSGQEKLIADIEKHLELFKQGRSLR